MKRIITTIAAATAIVLAAAPGAAAAGGRAPNPGCQPGAAGANDAAHAEGWQMMSVEQFAQFLVDEFNAPNYDLALLRAYATYEFCDHNEDGYACVMTQNLPNDANGSSHWWLAQDNHSFGG